MPSYRPTLKIPPLYYKFYGSGIYDRIVKVCLCHRQKHSNAVVFKLMLDRQVLENIYILSWNILEFQGHLATLVKFHSKQFNCTYV